MASFKSMANVLILLVAVSYSACFYSCKKKQEVKDLPPDELFGTWQPVDQDSTYMIIKKDCDTLFTTLIDRNWMRYLNIYHFSATSGSFKQDNTTFTYTLSGNKDTLNVFSMNKFSRKYFRVKNPSHDQYNFLTPVNILRAIPAPRGINHNSALSFGIDGDTLYPYVSIGIGKIYKFNSATGEYLDSMDFPELVTCYARPHLYYARGGIYKSEGFNKTLYVTGSTSINCINLSVNKSNNTLYAFDRISLTSAVEGDIMKEVFPGNGYDDVLYFRDGEFLVRISEKLYRGKRVGNNMFWMESYAGIEGHSIERVSTNGEDTWLFTHNKKTGRYELLKIKL